MGWGAKILGFFTGNAGGKVIDAADELYYSEEERAATDSSDTQSARAFKAPTHNTWLDVIVDGWSRLPRPAFATWAFGELVGWWDVPTQNISAEKMQLILLVVTFYFAGRAILKEMPVLLKALRGIK